MIPYIIVCVVIGIFLLTRKGGCTSCCSMKQKEDKYDPHYLGCD